MKHLFPLLLSAALLSACAAPAASSSSCDCDPSYALDLKVASPAGAPASALYKYVKDSHVEVTGAAAAYISANSDVDVVFAPTNAGIAAIKQGAPYQLAATVTFGNFFLVSTGKDSDGVLSADDYIVGFQQNAVPGKVISHAYPDLPVDYWTVGEGSEAMQKAAACAISGINTGDDNHPVDYVFLAEPAVTNVLSKNANASVVGNVQEKFKEHSSGMQITQASIFIRNAVAKEKADAFLAAIQKDVHEFLEDPTALNQYVEGIEAESFQSIFAVGSAQALINLTRNGNKMGLGFALAKDNKDAIANFMSLFGMTKIDEAVYYQ